MKTGLLLKTLAAHLILIPHASAALGPALRIEPDAPGFATISWSPATEAWVLQSSENLSVPNWIKAPSGGTNPITVATTNGSQFYRLAEVPETAGLVINEVDYDQAGTDTTEFVEVLNTANVTRDLSSLALVFINGASSTEYLRVQLSGTLAPGEYLVVASTNLTGISNGVQRINFVASDNNVQNGAPDGIALVELIGQAVIDALSYEGPINAATINGFPGTYNLVEGTALPAAVQDSNTTVASLVRTPNGQDTNDAATDWSLSNQPSPGSANQ